MRMLFDYCLTETVYLREGKADVYVRKYGQDTIGALWRGKSTYMSIANGKVFGASAPKAVINLLREFRRGLRLKGGLA